MTYGNEEDGAWIFQWPGENENKVAEHVFAHRPVASHQRYTVSIERLIQTAASGKTFCRNGSRREIV